MLVVCACAQSRRSSRAVAAVSRGEFKFAAVVVGPRSRAKRCVRAFLCSANQRRDACGTGRYRDARELQQCNANAAILQPCRAQAARGFCTQRLLNAIAGVPDKVRKASRGVVARVRLSVLTFCFAGGINLGETKLSSEAVRVRRAIIVAIPWKWPFEASTQASDDP